MLLVGIAMTSLLIALDMITVCYTTADHRLQTTTEQK
jgi:hypothetical protein